MQSYCNDEMGTSSGLKNLCLYLCLALARSGRDHGPVVLPLATPLVTYRVDFFMKKSMDMRSRIKCKWRPVTLCEKTIRPSRICRRGYLCFVWGNICMLSPRGRSEGHDPVDTPSPMTAYTPKHTVHYQNVQDAPSYASGCR